MRLQSLPLFWPSLAWVLGLAAARMESITWQWDICLLFVLLLGLILFKPIKWILWLFLGLCWGGLWLFYDAYQVHVDAIWLQQDVGFQAEVESIRLGASKRLRLKSIVRDDGVGLAGKVDVYVWRESLPQAGQKIHLRAKLHKPRNHHNPGGFDYESYAFDQHIALIGSLRGSISIVNAHMSLWHQWREQVRTALPLDRAQKGVLAALLLADRSLLPVSVQDAFAASGAAHLLAISGLHMGMVAVWAMLLCVWLLTRREVWIVILPIQSIALVFGLLVAIGYASLAAWPLPAQRAAWMLAAAALAWHLRARQQPVNSLLAALMLILLFDAAAVVSVSLWLSFVATLCLLLFAEHAENDAKYRLFFYFKGLLWVSLVAALATLPMTADIFSRLPVWSLAANMILLPLYAFWILPWALLGELLAILGWLDWAQSAMAMAAYVIDIGNQWLFYLQSLPVGRLFLADIALWYGLLYGFSLSLAAYLWWQSKRYWAVACMLSSLIIYIACIVPEKALNQDQWIVWDIGQGAAMSLLQSLPDKPSHVFVVDVPGRAFSKFNGGTTVATGLRALGLTHVDVLMLSHAQSDHAGGALRLIDSLNKVSELWLADVPANHAYAPMRLAIKRLQNRGGKVRWLKQGDDLNLGKAKLQVLWPPKAYAPKNDNNTSLVASITLAGGKRLFIGGDMEKPVEQALVSQHVLRPHDWMLMPHHGSRTSSSMTFLKQVMPSIVVAQTGKNNHFGFPKTDIIKRYQRIDAQVWNTADGAVMMNINTAHIEQFTQPNAVKRHVALQCWDLFL